MSGHELPKVKRLGIAEFVTLMAFMTSLVALSIDAMLPAMSIIGDELHANNAGDVHLAVSLFFLGLAAGQLYYGPYSDAKGRRAAILSGLVVFAIGTIVCMVAQSMDTLLVGRLIQAFGVSGPRVAALAVIRDQYQGEEMARIMSFIMMVFIMVPMAAPLVGQAVIWLTTWRHIFTLMLVFAAITGVWFFIRQGETLHRDNRREISIQNLLSSSRFILTHRKVLGYTLSMGLTFGAFLAYLSASQTIFSTMYDVSDWFPVIFAALAFAVGLASYFNAKMVMRLGMVRLVNRALCGLLIFTTALLWQTLYFQGLPPLWSLLCNLFLMFFCIGILFGNFNAMAMQPLGSMAGIGAALIGSFSSLFSVPVALLIDRFLGSDISPIAIGFWSFTLLTIATTYWANRAPIADSESR